MEKIGLFIRRPNIERLKRKRDIDGLIEALEHRDYPVRQKAAKALGLVGDSRAVLSLLKILDRWKHDDIMQSDIIRALGEIGDPSAVDALVDALHFSKYDFVRAAAAVALGKIGDKRAVESLIHALTHTSINSEAVAEAESIKAYTDVFGHPLPGRSIESIQVDIMGKVLIRQKVAEALGKIGDPRAIGALKKALEDKTPVQGVPVVYEAAKEALERIQRHVERRYFCQRCEAVYDKGDKFCKNCGAAV